MAGLYRLSKPCSSSSPAAPHVDCSECAQHLPLPRAKEERVKHVATNEELRPSNRPANRRACAGCSRCCARRGRRVGPLRSHHPAPRSAPHGRVPRAGARHARTRTAPLQRSLPRASASGSATAPSSPRPTSAASPSSRSAWRAAPSGAAPSTASPAARPYGAERWCSTARKRKSSSTVERRQGDRTWRWQLDTNLDPSLRVDGRVALVDRRTGGTFEIAPVRISRRGGDDITPAGLRWTVQRPQARATLDDRELPSPVRDRPGDHRRSRRTAPTRRRTTASLSLAKPTGALVSGSTILVAHVSKRNADAVSATGWTSIGQTCNGTTVCTALLWKKFAGEAGPYAFTWTNGVGAGRRHRRARQRVAAGHALARRLDGRRLGHQHDRQPRLAHQPLPHPRRDVQSAAPPPTAAPSPASRPARPMPGTTRSRAALRAIASAFARRRSTRPPPRSRTGARR